MNRIIQFLTNLLAQMERLESKLTDHKMTRKFSTRETPRFITLPPQGTRQDVRGSLALSPVLSPGARSRRRQKPG